MDIDEIVRHLRMLWVGYLALPDVDDQKQGGEFRCNS